MPVEGPIAADPHDRKRRRTLGISVVGVVACLQLTIQYLASHDLGRLFVHATYLLGALPILMVLLSKGFAWANRRRLGPLPAMLAGILVAGALGAAFGAGIRAFTHHHTLLLPQRDGGLARALAFGFLYGQLAYGLWALGFVVPFALEDARVRSLEADKLRLEAEKLRTAAELSRLRAHLEPHFLLNTLNAIAGLVTEDPREARRLLVCLGDLLRDALRDEDEMQPLDEQIAWLRRYAEILEARHPGDLVFRWEIAGETRDILLPRLLLQPLLENAVQHGALRRSGGGEVVVRTCTNGAPGGRMICTIEDNGPGMPEEVRAGAFGLHVVRRRLELKYRAGASLRFESSPGGTRSIVELPRQAAGAAS